MFTFPFNCISEHSCNASAGINAASFTINLMGGGYLPPQVEAANMMAIILNRNHASYPKLIGRLFQSTQSWVCSLFKMAVAVGLVPGTLARVLYRKIQHKFYRGIESSRFLLGCKCGLSNSTNTKAGTTK